ncbi:hypothetical protein [Nesterenkonia halobia]|uniref:Uncharacterized protein n=1 Tax=Nesterenkonia halobia TaxID=37922 RepID=A0ABP6RDP5_9MICC
MSIAQTSAFPSPPAPARPTLGPTTPFTQVPREALWNNQKFLSASNSAKLVYLGLITHKLVDAAGIVRATADGLSASLRTLAREDVNQALQELERLSLTHKHHEEIFVTAWFEITRALDDCNNFRSFIRAYERITYEQMRHCVRSWLGHAAQCRAEQSGGLNSSVTAELTTWAEQEGAELGPLKTKGKRGKAPSPAKG